MTEKLRYTIDLRGDKIEPKDYDIRSYIFLTRKKAAEYYQKLVDKYQKQQIVEIYLIRNTYTVNDNIVQLMDTKTIKSYRSNNYLPKIDWYDYDIEFTNGWDDIIVPAKGAGSTEKEALANFKETIKDYPNADFNLVRTHYYGIKGDFFYSKQKTRKVIKSYRTDNNMNSYNYLEA